MSANFSHTVRLTETGLSWLKAKLAKWGAVQIEATPVTVKDEWDVETVQFDTRVSLNAPNVPGHTLLARIEHTSEGNIVYRCAGEEKASYRTCPAYCDHCRTTRRRNDTFILREDATNREKQIGRNCLAEYVRDEGAAAYLLSWADMIDRVIRSCTDAEENYGSSRAPETYTLPYVISWSLAFGGKWISGSQARETGEQSSAAFLYALNGQLRYARMSASGKQWLESREGRMAQAIDERAAALRADENSDVYKTIAWIGTLKGESDYENNLSVIARLGYVSAKQWNFVCSAFRGWLRAEHVARGEAEQKAREAAGPKGNWVGEKGQRLGFEKCNCTEVKSLGVGDFGERFLYKFITPAGDELVWFTGASDFEAGKEYDITGTVKDHNEFRGQRSTVLSRVAEGVKKPKAKKAK